jgi:hypothetical protein
MNLCNVRRGSSCSAVNNMTPSVPSPKYQHVIASEAKQSREPKAPLGLLDRRVAALLAMTTFARQPITELLSVARVAFRRSRSSPIRRA